MAFIPTTDITPKILTYKLCNWNLHYVIWIEPMDALEGDSGGPVYIYKSASAELIGYLVSDVGGLKVAISVSGPIEFADTYPLTG